MKTNIVDIFCIVDNFSKLFDQTVKEKSIEKEGKKRMKQIGTVEVPQEAFLAILKTDVKRKE